MKTAGRKLNKRDHQEIAEAGAIWSHGRRKRLLTNAIRALVDVGMEKDEDGIKVLEKLRKRRKALDSINPLES